MMGEQPQKVVKDRDRPSGLESFLGSDVLIIWGVRVFFHTAGQGAFCCPRCGADRRYRRRSGRRFFTLFFVPIIPLSKVGEHVQCATCRTRYHPEALTLPRPAEQSAGAG